MKLKRILSLLMCLAALLVCVPAMADVNIVDIPVSLFNIILPDGLVLRNENPKQPGKLTLDVDTDQTNWAAVVASGHGNYAQMLYQFLVPTLENATPIGKGDAFIMFFEDPELTPEEMFADGERHPDSYRVIENIYDGVASTSRGMSENGITLGQYLPANEYLNPETMQDTRYICWYRKSGNDWEALTPYYRVQLSLTQTREKAFPMTGAVPVPAANISASVTPKNTEATFDRTAVVADGKVTFTMAVGDSANTVIRLPEGATHWRKPSLKGFPSSGNGNIDLSSSLDADNPVRASTQTYLIFTTENDEEKLMCTWSVNLCYETPENLAWPNYLPNDFTKLTVGMNAPSDRLIIRNGAVEAGYKLSFDNQTAHIISEFTGEVENNAALTGEVEVTVTPPAGAKSFRYTTEIDSGRILGVRYTSAADFDAVLNQSWIGTPDNPNLVGVHPLPAYSYNALRKITPADLDNLSIYVPSVSTMPYHANFMVINWYSDTAGKQLLQRDFVWETIDANEKPVLVPVVGSEEELKQPLKVPCVVGKGSQQAWRGNWQLLVKTYYQEGINARHYEFHLVDKDGKPVVLPEGEKLTVYLPVPEELEGAAPYETAFGLKHYSSKFYDEDDPDLEGTPVHVEMTEYGLRLETDSFSPFILSWEEGEPVIAPVEPALPKTGDSTPTLLLCALCAASLLTAVVIKRRKHA